MFVFKLNKSYRSNTNYIRPVTQKSGLIRCTGKVIHVGSRIATASGKIFDGNEKLVAHGMSTCVIFS
ncbi:MAG: PaaI family thioesterase [Dissulfuribacterales bacterium]